jgi:predicted enzyme related to lactoylglutathione lyase
LVRLNDSHDARLGMLRRGLVRANGGVELTDRRGAFAWYELLTTDTHRARDFYVRVVGWRMQDAPAAAFSYTVLCAGAAEIGGLMELPPDALRSGATPRWVGYVAVDDIDARVERLQSLGGSVFVPPTDSNIGRVSLVADPQTATFGMVSSLNRGTAAFESVEPGQVAWHELFAADGKKAFAFYRELLGWVAAPSENDRLDTYQLVTAGGDTRTGIFSKLQRAPVPFWLYYFEVADIAEALARVKEAGGRVVQGPMEILGGVWIARCIDPQGAMFSLQGKSGRALAEPAATSELNWAADWGGFASRGKVVAKPKG